MQLTKIKIGILFSILAVLGLTGLAYWKYSRLQYEQHRRHLLLTATDAYECFDSFDSGQRLFDCLQANGGVYIVKVKSVGERVIVNPMAQEVCRHSQAELQVTLEQTLHEGKSIAPAQFGLIASFGPQEGGLANEREYPGYIWKSVNPKVNSRLLIVCRQLLSNPKIPERPPYDPGVVIDITEVKVAEIWTIRMEKISNHYADQNQWWDSKGLVKITSGKENALEMGYLCALAKFQFAQARGENPPDIVPIVDALIDSLQLCKSKPYLYRLLQTVSQSQMNDKQWSKYMDTLVDIILNNDPPTARLGILFLSKSANCKEGVRSLTALPGVTLDKLQSAILACKWDDPLAPRPTDINTLLGVLKNAGKIPTDDSNPSPAPSTEPRNDG